MNYCESIHIPSLSDESIDVMRADIDDCEQFLSIYLYELEHLIPDELQQIKGSNYFIFNAQMDKVLALMQEHYAEFQKEAPESLNAKLMYYPDSPNPIKMITFTPALELLIGNTLKYIGVLLAISFATSISYSLVFLFSGGNAIPTLGLSGVVMGMIGLSAYLMPKAKIRVFVWWFTFARNIYISAWILAIWYIGWDAWELLTESDHGGINLIAHVSGGITGYLIGVFWLKETHDDTSDELADEIEYQRSKRADKHTSHNISFSGNQQYLANKQQERQFKKDESEYMSRLYQYVKCTNDSEAIVLILDDYDFQRVHVENYEDLFQRISEWGASRALLCMGRVCISLLLEKKFYKRASDIFKQCHGVSNNFVLADPNEVLLLARGMIELQQYEAAQNLINNADQCYGKYIDITRCQILETELLLHHLNKLDEARGIINILLLNPQDTYKKEILDLAKLIASL